MEKIVFAKGFDKVVDAKTQTVDVFSTKLPDDLSALLNRTHMPSDVVEKTVFIYNLSGLDELDFYLLNEDAVSQEEREVIIEGIYAFRHSQGLV